MLITLISALVLSHVQKVTYPNILKRELEQQNKALSVVLPGFRIGKKRTVKVDGNIFTFWTATRIVKGSVIRGYAFIAGGSGYSGNVKSVIGVNQQGKILGISILQQTETPGLGARCFEVSSTNTFFSYILGEKGTIPEKGRPWFQEQFTGLSIMSPIDIVHRGDWHSEMKEQLIEINAISAITGATITSRAVTKSIENGYVLLKKALAYKKKKGGDAR